MVSKPKNTARSAKPKSTSKVARGSAKKKSVPKTASRSKKKTGPTAAELQQSHALLDKVSSAVMVVNTDFVVQYVNHATMDLFARHAESFRRLFPDFNPADIVGTNIDKFHAVPAHQRRLLADPKNLPFRTDISVGNAKIQLNVSPNLDAKGNTTGFALEWSDVTVLRDGVGQLQAISKSQAVIEFDLSGQVLHANENFLSAIGYSLDEIRGRHHSIFVEPGYAGSAMYRDFWSRLNQGHFDSGEYKRIAKGGREVWIQASYNPIFDGNGKPFKVVKYATDITAAKVRNADYEGQLAAISKAQATIEFDLDGRIVTANDNFLSTLGYSLDEVKGKHHSLFVESSYATSAEYRQFWADLKAGTYQSAQYKRLGKGGREVWIQASYNPIFDLNGKPYKVVKYATDITAAKQMEFAIIDRQKADAKAAEDLKVNVAQILDVANRVSQGDYSVEITVAGEDGIGQLGQGLRKFFAEKKVAEAAERDRNERERRESEVQQRKVQQVLQIVNAVADGNFDLTVPDLGDDAVGQVAKALDSAIDSIRKALIAVRGVAGTVASAATQMTAASNEISKGAQNQASSLEETASSLEEITSTVKQNTDNAQQARQLANGSRDIAEKGGAVLTDAIKAMGEINQSSTKIADIITTIDEIAFQTNLLALNAAVEAARAGEQGRGFAVVAAEVRNLSQRSALAAKEIKALIQDSVRKVENGTNLVNQSGRTLEEIVGSVKRVTDIVAEIAAASKEQLAGIEQVNKAVSQMDRVTQNNASQTEEMAGTAEALQNHSEQLRELVTRFRLESSDSNTSQKAGRRTDSYQVAKSRQLETNLDKVVHKLETASMGFTEF